MMKNKVRRSNSGFKTVRIKNVVKSILGGGTPNTESKEYWDGSIPWVSPKDMKSDRITETIDYITERAIKESSTTLVKESRILMVARSGILKHTLPVAINTVPVALNQDMKAILPTKQIELSFLLWCLKGYSIEILKSCSKVGATVDSIEIKEFLTFLIALPSSAEQIAIAEYLDNKTQAIDKKVSLLEKKIGYYQELRKSLIYETVTKGLDKNAKFKNSGIDWIGLIPRHWEVKRGKDIFKEISRKNRPDLPLLAASQKQGVVLKSMLENRSMEAQKSFEIFKWVKPKDFVISLRSFEGGIETAFYEGIISPAYTVFNFRTSGNITSYFTYLFKSACFIDFLQSSITGIRDGQSVKFIELERAFFAIPPVSEQEQIAYYLTEKTSKIDQIIANLQTQITTMKELRKTLINDVVTGKIKVTKD